MHIPFETSYEEYVGALTQLVEALLIAFSSPPPNHPVRLDGFKVKTFSVKIFGSVAAINRLHLSPLLYQSFEDYRYIFIYHLDSLVFSNQMELWLATDLDYIGAPWIRCEDAPWVEKDRVGNTGFGMMKVEASLKVLANRYRQEPMTYWMDLFIQNSRTVRPLVDFLRKLQRYFPQSKITNSPVKEWDIMQDPSPHGRLGDVFWTDRAVEHDPGYRVASLEEGLEFAFEVGPRKCFVMNGGKMPFGCHAWEKYDRSFWEPHLFKRVTEAC